MAERDTVCINTFGKDRTYLPYYVFIDPEEVPRKFPYLMEYDVATDDGKALKDPLSKISKSCAATEQGLGEHAQNIRDLQWSLLQIKKDLQDISNRVLVNERSFVASMDQQLDAQAYNLKMFTRKEKPYMKWVGQGTLIGCAAIFMDWLVRTLA